MLFLNLSPGLQFQPALAHETFIFKGGEPHIKIAPDVTERCRPDQTQVCVSVQARTAQDILLVLLANDALRRMGFSDISLYIPYFPAARQDRLMTVGEPLSVKIYADLINAAGFRRVWIFDPHSDVAPALLERCQVVSNHAFTERVVAQIPNADRLTLIAPDAGASKKIRRLAEALGCDRIVQCDKTRNTLDGALSNVRVFSDDLEGADCLIVDDICDGGGTFIPLAEALRAKNAGRIFLAVSHGIFSRGTEVLRPHFEQIFTTDSFYNASSGDQIAVLSAFEP